MEWPAIVLILLSMACVAPLPAWRDEIAEPAAQSAGQTIRVSVNLVQTDVMVFDRAGRFVDDLGPQLFDLRVDGVSQPIAFFELVDAGSPEDETRWSGPVPTTDSSAHAATAAAPDLGRSVFFYVDDLHLSAIDVPRVRRSLLRFVDHALGSNDQAAIVLASGRSGFLEQLTDSRHVLRSALSLLSPWDAGIRDGDRPPMQEYQALAIEQNNSDVFTAFVDATMRENDFDFRRRAIAEQIVRTRAKAMVRRSADVTQRTLASLENLLKSSATLPGRKLVFFLSDGFMLQPQASSVLMQLKAVTDAAARAGTVIYSIDARGLNPELPDASTTPFVDASGRLTAATASADLAAQDGMYNVAAQTGGRFLRDVNFLNAAISQTLVETSRYYILAWHLNGANGTTGKRSIISASIRGRSDLTVRVRQGSLDLASLSGQSSDGPRTARQSKPQEDPLVETIKTFYPRAALSTSLYAACMHEPDLGWRLTIGLQVEGAKLTYVEADGQRKAQLDVLGVVFNDKGVEAASFRQKLTATQKTLKDSRPDVSYTQVLPIRPGLYQVRVAIRDTATGDLGCASQWIEIPVFAPGRLSLSSIFLGDRATDSSPPVSSTGDSDRLDLNVSRAYAASSQLYFVLQIYNAACPAADSPPKISVSMRLYNGNRVVLDTPARLINSSGSDPARVSFGAGIPLERLPVGLYTFELTVFDQVAKTSATERTSLKIR